MTDTIENILGKTTYNAGQWAIALEEYVAQRPDDDKQAKSYGKARKKVMIVLMGNLRDAIAAPAGGHGPGEFDTSALREPLLAAFDNEEIFQVFDGYVDLEEGAYLLAGDEQDWADGIAAARESLGLGGGKFTAAQRAKFWRDFIYGPARIGMDENIYSDEEDDYSEDARLQGKEWYDTTIQVRLMEWEGGAPYWVILEFGNQESNLAFPKFKGTHFLERSRREAQLIYDKEILDVENQEENIVLREVANFLDSPDDFEPYDILAEFYADSKKYHVYVTKRRRIGVALRVRRGR